MVMPDLMPNEMTAAEAAEKLEWNAEHMFCNENLDDSESANACNTAASMLRAIAAGEYKRVVYCDDCVLLDRSPCPARDPETGKTRNCVGYCRVGALMDESRDGNSHNGKDDDKLN